MDRVSEIGKGSPVFNVDAIEERNSDYVKAFQITQALADGKFISIGTITEFTKTMEVILKEL